MFDTKKAFCLQNTWRQWFGVNLLNKISSNKKRRRNEVFEIPLEEDNLEYPKNMAHGSQWRCLFPRLFKWKIAVAESHTRKSTNQRHRDKLVDILKHKSNMANKKGTPPRKLTWIPKKWWLGWNGDSLEKKGHFWYLRGQISGVTNHQTTTAGWSFIGLMADEKFRRPKWCCAPRSPERHKQLVRAVGEARWHCTLVANWVCLWWGFSTHTKQSFSYRSPMFGSKSFCIASAKQTSAWNSIMNGYTSPKN